MQLDFKVSFSLCTGHIERERERASILTSANVERQREFSCVIHHSYSASNSSTWYIDSGTSSYMTCAREMFSELSQADIDVEVVLGDESVVNAVGRGTITF